MEEEDIKLVKTVVDTVTTLAKVDEQTLDKTIEKLQDQTLIGGAMMVGGAILTPICPAVGPGLVAFGYGYTVGSTFMGGTVASAKFIKKLQE